MKGKELFDGFFRGIIGFLVGMFLAYMTKLSGTAGWWIGVVIMAGMFVFFWFMDVSDRGFTHLIAKMTGGGGVKPARKQAKPHWFVRFGWIIAVAFGFAAAFILPEGALAWLT